jgi:hypothetical protein
MPMNRPVEVLRGAVTAIRERLSAVAAQPVRSLMLSTILLALAVSWATGFVLTQYFSVDVLSSLFNLPEDCYLNWGTQIGRHCFGDYSIVVGQAIRPNPWEPYPLFLPWENYQPFGNNYPAAAMIPQLLFGLLGEWLHTPRLGALLYLTVLTIAVLAPAVWAAKGARGLERVVVFVTCGAVAIPAWNAIDSGNSVGFLPPIGLVFLVALCRQRWGLVAVMVVLAALLKPMFAILALALFGARQWRSGTAAVVGTVVSSLAAYLLWPRDFPQTIVQSIRGLLSYASEGGLAGVYNLSFGNGLLYIPRTLADFVWGGVPYFSDDRLISVIGYVVLGLVAVFLLVLGQRIPPVMAGITLLATASLFPLLVGSYYLVFVLPVAAVVVRDPDGPPGSGIFDRFAAVGDRRRAVGICVSLAAALSIAQIALPTHPYQVDIPAQLGATGVVGTTRFVVTTAETTPFLWLIACAAIIVSYVRRRAPTRAAVTGAAAASDLSGGSPDDPQDG